MITRTISEAAHLLLHLISFSRSRPVVTSSGSLALKPTLSIRDPDYFQPIKLCVGNDYRPRDAPTEAMSCGRNAPGHIRLFRSVRCCSSVFVKTFILLPKRQFHRVERLCTQPLTAHLPYSSLMSSFSSMILVRKECCSRKRIQLPILWWTISTIFLHNVKLVSFLFMVDIYIYIHQVTVVCLLMC